MTLLGKNAPYELYTAILVANFQIFCTHIATRRRPNLIHLKLDAPCASWRNLIMRLETIFTARKKRVSPDIIPKQTKWNDHCTQCTPLLLLLCLIWKSWVPRMGKVKKICNRSAKKSHKRRRGGERCGRVNQSTSYFPLLDERKEK